MDAIFKRYVGIQQSKYLIDLLFCVTSLLCTQNLRTIIYGYYVL